MSARFAEQRRLPRLLVTARLRSSLARAIDSVDDGTSGCGYLIDIVHREAGYDREGVVAVDPIVRDRQRWWPRMRGAALEDLDAGDAYGRLLEIVYEVGEELQNELMPQSARRNASVVG